MMDVFNKEQKQYLIHTTKASMAYHGWHVTTAMDMALQQLKMLEGGLDLYQPAEIQALCEAADSGY